ncbi:MAG: AbrB/MazE/SpoVT family DNA-binding domain-containing protein [Phycisphaerales bacterium]|nr:AbrB/MazE/SpoVT family DNA-binding domain-containing protein [Phycisphaerales bacterium]
MAKTIQASLCIAEDGSVVIPANICSKLKFKEGTEVVMMVEGEQVILMSKRRMAARKRKSAKQ